MIVQCILAMSFVALSHSLSTGPVATSGIQSRVLVCGATGRVGAKTVEELLKKESVSKVRAFVRDKGKISSLKKLEGADEKLEIFTGDLTKQNDIKRACNSVDAAIWCVSGFSDQSSPINRFLGLFSTVVTPKDSVDVRSLEWLGEEMAKNSVLFPGPQVLLCSSAGVTRPTWDAAKQEKLVGAADIPIVRLNPFNILDIKREGEQGLRKTGVPFCILRPTGKLRNSIP